MTKLKIISFNILAEQFIDYKDTSVDYPDVPIEALHEKNRLPKIFAFLKEINPDVMLLQEVNHKTQKMLYVNLSRSHIIFPLALHHTAEALEKGNAYGNTIIVRKGLFKQLKHRIYRVPILGTAFAVLYGEFKHKPFVFVNVHLDADEKFEKKRRIEIETLMSLLRHMMDTHVILVSGDFNTSNEKTHAKFRHLRPVVENPRGTYLADDPMIDWIYVKNAEVLEGRIMKPARVANQTVLKKYGSDHWPIFAEIKI